MIALLLASIPRPTCFADPKRNFVSGEAVRSEQESMPVWLTMAWKTELSLIMVSVEGWVEDWSGSDGISCTDVVC